MLRVLTDRLRDFCSVLLAAYVDLRKAFDSVNLDLLWESSPSAEYPRSSSVGYPACILVQKVL